MRLERVGEADHCLGSAEREETVGLHALGESSENLRLHLLIEIDQHVAAEDDVELTEMREVGQQVQRLVLDHRAQFRRNLPHVADLLEVLHQQLDRQAALHFELGVDAGLGLLQHLLGDVGADDLDAPAGELRAHLLDHHGNRIRLLPRRGGGAPDAQAAASATRLDHFRQHDVTQMIERHLVAEEEGLIGGHRFDHFGAERRIAVLDLLNEIIDAVQIGLAGQRHQAAFDQVLLVRRQIEAGLFLQELTEEIVIGRRHERSPENKRVIFAPI